MPKADTSTAVAETKTRSVLSSMANRYNTDGNQLLDTLKNTVFKKATNEQLIALCIVADQYNLNPFTKEIYAFPDSKTGGIIPVVGIDGWLRIINDHPQYDGMEVENDAGECTVTIHRKDRAHPTVGTEYLSECIRDTGPWNSHPARMLRHKAIIQCARMAFGFALKDPDEADRIINASSIDAESYEPAPIAMPKALPATQTQAQTVENTQQTQTAEEQNVIGIITHVEHRTSNPDSKKQWEKWGISIEGVAYGTFDKKLGALAEECRVEGCVVAITIEQKGKYFNVLTLEKKAEAPEGKPVNKDVDTPPEDYEPSDLDDLPFEDPAQ